MICLIVIHYQINSGGKVWRSASSQDAGLFTPDSRPHAILDMYDGCERVPNLGLVQEFREDDKDCRKLYSDPGMFFRIWRDHVIEEAKKAQKSRTSKKKDPAKVGGRKNLNPTRIITTRVCFTSFFFL